MIMVLKKRKSSEKTEIWKLDTYSRNLKLSHLNRFQWLIVIGIFKNVKIVRNYFLQRKINCEMKFFFLKNILFVEVKISKLMNYSTNICQSCKGTRVITQGFKKLRKVGW
jgi:hypothetical protein